MTLHPWDRVRLMALRPHGIHVAMLASDREGEPPVLIGEGFSAVEVRSDVARRLGTVVLDRCDVRPAADVLAEAGR